MCSTFDGQVVGTWTKEEWDQGINLAQVSTPMTEQALQVQALTLRHYDVRLARWQGVQVGLQKENSSHVREALSSLDSLEDELREQQRVAAGPRRHVYKLVAAEK